SAKMRYQGQSFEIEVPLEAKDLEGGHITALREAFHREHERLYQYRDHQADIQVISLQVIAKALTPHPYVKPMEKSNMVSKPVKHVRAWMDSAFHEVPLYRREDLHANSSVPGPAIVVQDDTTTCVLPGFDLDVDR